MMKVTSKSTGIDAVREIIFGEQIKSYNKRIETIEMKIDSKLKQVENKIKVLNKAVATLEAATSNETGTLLHKADLSKLLKGITANLDS